MKDLLCLAADKNLEAALRGLLARPAALGLNAVDFDVLVHPRRDPGCYHEAHGFLQPFRDRYHHALVVFDRAWEGAPAQNPLVLEQNVRQRLGNDGWGDVVVIDPEIEVWVWSDSPHVEDCLGWRGRNPDLRTWLHSQGLWTAGRAKPDDPKEAVDRALRAVRIPRSSAIYGNLARLVSVARCTDDSFAKFCACLRQWFSPKAP
ncbi:MAG: hypothetical protein V2A73_04660 [Pseudomonadota bacterium]